MCAGFTLSSENNVALWQINLVMEIQSFTDGLPRIPSEHLMMFNSNDTQMIQKGRQHATPHQWFIPYVEPWDKSKYTHQTTNQAATFQPIQDNGRTCDTHPERGACCCRDGFLWTLPLLGSCDAQKTRTAA